MHFERGMFLLVTFFEMTPHLQEGILYFITKCCNAIFFSSDSLKPFKNEKCNFIMSQITTIISHFRAKPPTKTKKQCVLSAGCFSWSLRYNTSSVKCDFLHKFQYRARGTGTGHGVRGTGYGAQGAGYKVRGTEHGYRARGTGHGCAKSTFYSAF